MLWSIYHLSNYWVDLFYLYATYLINLIAVFSAGNKKGTESLKMKAYIIFMVYCLETNDFFSSEHMTSQFHSWLPWSITFQTLVLQLLLSDYSLSWEMVTPKHIYRISLLFFALGNSYTQKKHFTNFILSALSFDNTSSYSYEASVDFWKVLFILTIKT